jgi:rod shape determining protein RodA
VVAISSLGAWNLGSAGGDEYWFKQLVWLLGGAVVVLLTLLVDYRVLRSFVWPVFLVTMVLLVAVPLVGTEVKGARRWLRLGGATIQPSEFAKIAVILMLARYFGDHPAVPRQVKRIGRVRAMWLGLGHYRDRFAAYRRRALAAPPRRMAVGGTVRETGYRLLELVPAFVAMLLPAVFVIKQPDLGTGLSIIAIGGSMILFSGLTRGTLALLGGGSLSVAVLAWNFALKPYQKARVFTFLDPMADPQGKAYHAIQSFIAVGSGQVWGKGWGAGTQNQLQFLPEQHTDFAFPVWAEEHGFVGSLIAVVLYLFLVLCALDIASNARDRFGAFLAFGAGALFFWHAFINIGMVTGVLPVVGVPLLLFSYGGSSALLSMMAIGVLLNVSLRRTQFQ